MKITPESTKKRRSAKNYAKNYARYLKKSPTTKISDNKKKINVELQKNHKKKSKKVIENQKFKLSNRMSRTGAQVEGNKLK